MSFESLGLSAELLRAVAAQGYANPTPIQARAIPEVRAGKDILAGAQTGTGKTAAFTLPMLQLLNQSPNRTRHPRALVLTPTRELAAQVSESVHTYGKHLPLRSAVIFGGVGMQPQIDRLRRGVDLVVATPGRLLDHAGRRTLDLSRIEILVLDEADRMLDMGFIHDIRRILALLPKTRQNLLFSATYSREIEQLANRLLRDPVLIEVAHRNTAAEGVSQVAHPVEKGRKRELLSHLIHSGSWEQVLVFTRTKHGANRLSDQLVRDGISAAAIHGNKSQSARTRALRDFKQGEVRALVATDIAARGLDIDRLPHVVNFELPNVPEDYVHRIGRTGRAGADGTALSLVSPEENKMLIDIQRLLRRDIPLQHVDGFELLGGSRTGTAEPSRHSDAPPRRRNNRSGNRSGRQQRRRDDRTL
ncbi:MAG: DEAD/DEAH box helicase [Pseudomonadota bacterium]|nr:DEAD/DEAH box helicase [Pseudomonadota bacterium]